MGATLDMLRDLFPGKAMLTVDDVARADCSGPATRSTDTLGPQGSSRVTCRLRTHVASIISGAELRFRNVIATVAADQSTMSPTSVQSCMCMALVRGRA